MSKNKLWVLFAFFFLFKISLYAEQWIDPSWKEMILKSDAIVLGEISKEGSYHAKVKVLKTFFGKLPQTEFWVNGFSNRYGPHNTLRVGEHYYFFLRKPEYSDKIKKSIQKNLREQPNNEDYSTGIEQDNVFSVWTPTTGEIFTKGDSVYYDLLFNNDAQKHAPKSKTVFETFLFNARKGTCSPQYFEQLLADLQAALLHPTKQRLASQCLSMLYILNHAPFYPIYENAQKDSVPETRFALAQLLGLVKDERAFQLLSLLLDDPSSVIQGEAVRQLKAYPTEKIGSLLLSKLPTAGTGGIYPSNLMDPVANQWEGGKIEIIKTLGNLKFKPAGQALLPLLDTENEYLFKTVIDALVQIGERGYTDYLSKHLNKGTQSLIFKICALISSHKLVECKPALKNYIQRYGKNTYHSQSYLVSTCCGLGAFDDNETHLFMMDELTKLLSPQDTTKEEYKDDWIAELIKTFAAWKYAPARSLVQQAMLQRHGYNSTFGAYPQLFTIIQNLEDSIQQKVIPHFGSDSFKVTASTIIILKNSESLIRNETQVPNYEAFIQMNLSVNENILHKSAQEDKGNLTAGSTTYFRWIEQARLFLVQKMALKYENTAAICNHCVSGCYKRFGGIYNSRKVSESFWEYCVAVPHKADLQLVTHLIDVQKRSIYYLEKAQKQLKKKF